jgi:diacylglycerol kinase (ATP)
MTGKEKLNLCVIINPIAGKGKTSSVAQQILEKIDAQKFNIVMKTSDAPGEVEKLAIEAVQSGTNVIVAVGGDGTVNEVARTIVNTEIILGIIPLGSGNGLANHLKIPKSIDKAAGIINRMNVRLIDTGTINNHFFVSVAGIGFDATVAKAYANAPSRGFRTYLRSTVKKYFSYKPARYKIKFNDQLIARRALLITFANSDQFGYNTSIAPEATIDDGFFDMCIVRKVPPMKALFVLPKLFTHRIHRSSYHETWKVTEATVFRKRTSVIQIDGEPVTMKEKIIRIRNHKHSLKIIA